MKDTKITLDIITVFLNTICAILWFFQKNIVFGTIWAITSILWTITTIIDIKDKKEMNKFIDLLK